MISKFLAASKALLFLTAFVFASGCDKKVSSVPEPVAKTSPSTEPTFSDEEMATMKAVKETEATLELYGFMFRDNRGVIELDNGDTDYDNATLRLEALARYVSRAEASLLIRSDPQLYSKKVLVKQKLEDLYAKYSPQAIAKWKQDEARKIADAEKKRIAEEAETAKRIAEQKAARQLIADLELKLDKAGVAFKVTKTPINQFGTSAGETVVVAFSRIPDQVVPGDKGADMAKEFGVFELLNDFYLALGAAKSAGYDEEELLVIKLKQQLVFSHAAPLWSDAVEAFAVRSLEEVEKLGLRLDPATGLWDIAHYRSEARDTTKLLETIARAANLLDESDAYFPRQKLISAEQLEESKESRDRVFGFREKQSFKTLHPGVLDGEKIRKSKYSVSQLEDIAKKLTKEMSDEEVSKALYSDSLNDLQTNKRKAESELIKFGYKFEKDKDGNATVNEQARRDFVLKHRFDESYSYPIVASFTSYYQALKKEKSFRDSNQDTACPDYLHLASLIALVQKIGREHQEQNERERPSEFKGLNLDRFKD